MLTDLFFVVVVFALVGLGSVCIVAGLIAIWYALYSMFAGEDQ